MDECVEDKHSHGLDSIPRTFRLRSMPNFRRIVPAETPDDICEDRRSKRGRSLKLFRSSRPDNLSVEEVDDFLRLNIRSVVDLRSAREYRRASGPKLLDAVYPVYEVLLFVTAILGVGDFFPSITDGNKSSIFRLSQSEIYAVFFWSRELVFTVFTTWIASKNT